MLKKVYMVIMILALLMGSSIYALTVEEAKYHLGETITALESVLVINEDLEKENEQLRKELEKSNEIIKEFIELTNENQKEIEQLRQTIRDVSKQVDEDRNVIVGLGASYPTGITTIFGVRPNNIPFGAFFIGSVSVDYGTSISVGASYSF